jgi:anti-anti-sigma factor
MDDFRLLARSEEDGVLELAVGGELDLSSVGRLEETLDAAIASRAYRQIEIDLEGLSFIDSSGLHALASADRAMRQAGGEVKVICSAAHLLKVFELIGLDQVLTIVREPHRVRQAA